MLTFEQHDFELCGYIYMEIIFCSKDLSTGRKKKKLKKQNCRGREFDPWSGNLRAHMPHSKAKKKKQDYLVCG